MMKVFLSVAAFFRRFRNELRAAAADFHEQENWRHDPLSHPALAAMGERDLADLPFEPKSVWR